MQKKGAVDDYVIRRLLQLFWELVYQENKVVVRSDQKLAKERGEALTILRAFASEIVRFEWSRGARLSVPRFAP